MLFAWTGGILGRHALLSHVLRTMSFPRPDGGVCGCARSTARSRRCRDGGAAAASRGDDRCTARGGLRLVARILGVGGRPARVGAGPLGGTASGHALGGASVGSAGGRLAPARGALGARRLARLGPGRGTRLIAQTAGTAGIEPMLDEAVGYGLARGQVRHTCGNVGP